jgi:rhodanese-related sulfurtransferase
MLDPGQPIVIVAELGREVEAATRLGRIGFDGVAGYLGGGMQALDARPELLERTERVTASSLAAQLEGPEPPLVVDVRTPREWEEKHVEGAVNVSLAQLRERAGSLPDERAIVVYCTSGYRSAIAASLLMRDGFPRVSDLVGGLGAWESVKLPTAA